MRSLAPLLLALAALHGCGQMGPLYLPSEEAQAAGPAVADPAAPAQADEEPAPEADAR